MSNAKEFLIKKGMIEEGFSEFFIQSSEFGRISLNELLDEYAAISQSPSSGAEVLVEALRDLVILKDYKDAIGKDDHYLKRQPIVWENAKQTLIQYNQMNNNK